MMDASYCMSRYTLAKTRKTRLGRWWWMPLTVCVDTPNPETRKTRLGRRWWMPLTVCLDTPNLETRKIRLGWLGWIKQWNAWRQGEPLHGGYDGSLLSCQAWRADKTSTHYYRPRFKIAQSVHWSEMIYQHTEEGRASNIPYFVSGRQNFRPSQTESVAIVELRSNCHQESLAFSSGGQWEPRKRKQEQKCGGCWKQSEDLERFAVNKNMEDMSPFKGKHSHHMCQYR